MKYIKLSQEELKKLKEAGIAHQELVLEGLVWEWIDSSEIPWRKEEVWRNDFVNLTEEEFNEIITAIEDSDVIGELTSAIDRVAYAKYQDIVARKHEIQG